MKKAYDPFLRVLVKRPGLPLRAEVVENTLRSMQELVDGPIECVTVTEDLAIVCNEEGRIRGLSPSASILRMQFVGPVAFVGVRDEIHSVLDSLRAGRLRESDIVAALAEEENILTDWARRDRK